MPMRWKVQARFPQDVDVALLTADALMNLSPWDYWADGGRTPKGVTERMVALIEGVLGERQVGSLSPNPTIPGRSTSTSMRWRHQTVPNGQRDTPSGLQD